METPQPRRSADWQQQAHKARRTRGFTEGNINLSSFEHWTLTSAYRITGIAPNQWLKLCAVRPGWTINRIEGEVANLAYSLEEGRKCSLADLESAEEAVRQYAATIRQQLAQIEEATRSQWAGIHEGVR